MTFLGGLLDLGDEARLTHVTVLPPGIGVTVGYERTSVALHVFELHDDSQPAEMGGAIAAHLSSPVAALSGIKRDGRPWAAVAHLTSGGYTGEAAIVRAEMLLGWTTGSRTTHEVDLIDFDLIYLERGVDLDGMGWDARDLFLGLVVELATASPLEDIVSRADTAKESTDERLSPRSDTLHHYLSDWADTRGWTD